MDDKGGVQSYLPLQISAIGAPAPVFAAAGTVDLILWNRVGCWVALDWIGQGHDKLIMINLFSEDRFRMHVVPIKGSTGAVHI